MAKRKATDKVQLKVRMQEELRAVLEGAAKEKDVSLNQEIVERLKTALTDRVIEANQKLIVAQLEVLSTQIDQIIFRLEGAEAKLKSVHELSEGGYQELTSEIKELRSALLRGGVNLDPEDRR